MLSGDPITYRQLMFVLKKDIAWCRVCQPDRADENCMSAEQIRESVYRHGDRLVRRVYPGYHFVIVYLERA